MKRCTSLVLLSGALLACGPPPEPGAAPSGPAGEGTTEPSLLVPSGYGTLLQDQVTLRIQKDDLLIKVTPLEEWIIRLTAPDTYLRLRSLALTHGERATRQMLPSPPALFLVSFFSYQPNVTYEPEDLLLMNRGLRYRPLGIAPVTPSWGMQRLGQQETQMAVYAFDGGMDLTTDLGVEYQDLRNETWRDGILPVLIAEASKARARAGGT